MREGARRSEKDVYGGGDQCMVQAFQALCGKPMGWLEGVEEQTDEEERIASNLNRIPFF